MPNKFGLSSKFSQDNNPGNVRPSRSRSIKLKFSKSCCSQISFIVFFGISFNREGLLKCLVNILSDFTFNSSNNDCILKAPVSSKVRSSSFSIKEFSG